MSARTVADTYLAAVNSADLDGVRALLTETAVLYHSLGTFEGADAVVGFYRDVVFPAGVRVESEGYAGEDDSCACNCSPIRRLRRAKTSTTSMSFG